MKQKSPTLKLNVLKCLHAFFYKQLKIRKQARAVCKKLVPPVRTAGTGKQSTPRVMVECGPFLKRSLTLPVAAIPGTNFFYSALVSGMLVRESTSRFIICIICTRIYAQNHCTRTCRKVYSLTESVLYIMLIKNNLKRRCTHLYVPF